MQSLKILPTCLLGGLQRSSAFYKGLLSLLLAASLMACGGGTSVSDLAATPAPETPSSGSSGSTTNTNTAPLILTPGAYVATLNNKDWVTMVLRTQQGSGAVSSFLSLYYNSADPDIVSGSGLIAGSSSAVLNNVMVFQNTLASVRTGSGSLSKPSENALKAELNFPATGAELAKSMSVLASMPSTYQYNVAPALSSVQGTWYGRLSYGIGSSDNFSLVVSAQGAVSSSLNFQQDCRITQSTLLPNFDGTNLFVWHLSIPNATQCSFKNQNLTGAAFVVPSPVAGKTQRLYAVAISTDGRGVSFKADR
jgi:hypothetical protein